MERLNQATAIIVELNPALVDRLSIGRGHSGCYFSRPERPVSGEHGDVRSWSKRA